MDKIRALHEPLSPNGASAYGNLCTVVQAFPLAVLFSVVSAGNPSIYENVIDAIHNHDLGLFPWTKVNETVLLISVVAAIWHRYVTDNNFVAWELNWIDTLIPFGFGALQSFLAVYRSLHQMLFGLVPGRGR